MGPDVGRRVPGYDAGYGVRNRKGTTMGIGISVLLLVVGLVMLTGAVDLPASVTDRVATDTVGWICVIVAVLGFVLALMAGRNRAPRA